MKQILKFLQGAVFALTLLLFTPLALAQYGGTDYESAGVRSAMAVKGGLIVDVLQSHVREDASTSSRVVGGAIGALLCSKATNHWNSYVAQASAMTACGAIAERVANRVAATTVPVQTFIVQLDDGGQQLAVVQSDLDIRRGDRVYVTLGQGTRIIKAGN